MDARTVRWVSFGAVASRLMRSRLPSRYDWLEITVSLRHIVPSIWRKLQLPAEIPLDLLHAALQIAFGWDTSHAHDFRLGELRFALPDEDDDLLAIDEQGAPLGALLHGKTKLVYTYDFGDGWEHEIVAGDMLPQGEAIVCVEGARACPPEDCGGPPGYQHLLEALADKAHPEHAELRAWAGRTWSPEKLDLVAVNKKLATFSRKIGLIGRAGRAPLAPVMPAMPGARPVGPPKGGRARR